MTKKVIFGYFHKFIVLTLSVVDPSHVQLVCEVGWEF